MGLPKCGPMATCVETRGGYECICIEGIDINTLHLVLLQCDTCNIMGKGFRLLNNHKCTDINECEEGIDECHVDGLCRNKIGSYTCNCQEGYIGISNQLNCNTLKIAQGDGINCKFDDMCEDVVCLENQICRSNQISLVNSNYNGVLAAGGAAVVDNPNAFECICVPGYEPLGMGCVNVDECVSDSHTCVEFADCTDTPGSYECACKPGFEGKVVQSLDSGG